MLPALSRVPQADQPLSSGRLTLPEPGRKMPAMDRTRTDFPRTWEEVCNNPLLADLPYRVEINRSGNLEMSPHYRIHAIYQKAIVKLLDRLLKGGFAYTECPIKAPNSNPVADVVWTSYERNAAEDAREAACRVAPEICIEVRSPSNSQRQMDAKRQEYFDAGALECWFCDLAGGMSFYGPDGRIERSLLCPKFPTTVKL